ncbi:M15 family metallopeptidase [Deinococcus oregonensis]|uniref:M15 family metallopeptidase n=1 Tax=Deinococcus oregonensis TaxID=1805970 RepID=A0ABV6AUM9_9DEIO
MTFDFKAAIQARPSGESTAALINFYGNPEGPGAGASSQGPAWFTPSSAWARENLTRVQMSDLPDWPTYPGAEITGVTVHRLVAPVLIATWADVVSLGLAKHLRTFNGAFAARHMGHDRTRPLSVHAFAAAIDFDAAWNGYGVPLERMQINRDVVRVFEERGWTWGGRWSTPYEDGMHFQWTDPLKGTPTADWQDAKAKAALQPIPASPFAPTRRVLLSQGGGPFTDISDARVEIKGAGSVVINAKESDVWVRVD